MGYEDVTKMGEWSQLEACLDRELASENRPSAETMDEALANQLIAYREYRRTVVRRNKSAFRDGVWITSTGEEIKIQDMRDLHLRNAIHWLRRQPKKNWRQKYIGALEAEFKKRGLVEMEDG